MAVILIDRGAHRHAADWYRSSPSEREEHSFSIELAGQTSAALASWGTRHLGREVTGRFFYHGMWRTSAAPGSPKLLFVGDGAYTEHLQVV